MATEHIAPTSPTSGDSEVMILKKILLVLIAGSGGVPAASDQIKFFTADPNVEGILPGDQTKGAIAIPAGGVGSWYQWRTDTLTWV